MSRSARGGRAAARRQWGGRVLRGRFVPAHFRHIVALPGDSPPFVGAPPDFVDLAKRFVVVGFVFGTPGLALQALQAGPLACHLALPFATVA